MGDLIDREAAIAAIKGSDLPFGPVCAEDTGYQQGLAEAAAALLALPSATQAGGENQALRAMIRVNMLRYGPAGLTHKDIDRQIEAAIAAFAPLPPAPEGVG